MFDAADSEGRGFSLASLVFFCLFDFVFSLFVAFGSDFLARFGELAANKFCASGLSTAFLFVVFFETGFRDFCFSGDGARFCNFSLLLSILVAFFGTFFFGRARRGALVFFGVGVYSSVSKSEESESS